MATPVTGGLDRALLIDILTHAEMQAAIGERTATALADLNERLAGLEHDLIALTRQLGAKLLIAELAREGHATPVRPLEVVYKETIANALAATGGNIAHAADLLQIKRTRLVAIVRRKGLRDGIQPRARRRPVPE